MITQLVEFDVKKDSHVKITAKEGDINSRNLEFRLLDNSLPFSLVGRTVRCYMVKPDKRIVFNDLHILDAEDGRCVLKLTLQSLIVSGMAKLELIIYEAGKKLSVIPIKMDIIKSLNSNELLESTNEFGALNDALWKIDTFKASIDSKASKEDLKKLSSQLDTSAKFKIIGEGVSVPPISGGSGVSYVHPATHPASMITGLSKVATSGLYSDLIGVPTTGENSYTLPIASSTTLGGVKIGDNLSIDSNGVLSAINNSNDANITISNTLDNYSGATLSDKMVAMFNDINTNHKNTPMLITLPSGVIEVTQDLTAIGWTNKVFKGECILYFKNCNAIEFKQCQHNDIYIHRVSSAIPSGSSNPQGFINPSAVAGLTKRGIKITDCSYNKFEFNTILGFTNAIEIYSEYGALGSFYNNIYFSAIWRCQRPIIFRTGKTTDDTSSQSGWITEIFVHGGMFDCDDGVLVGQEVASRPANEPKDNYQGLKFYNLGVEHVRKKENGIGIYFLQGKNNAVINPRFEGSLLTGNTTSGAYILVKESGYACNNRIETSNYPINIDRVQLNYLAKQLANPNYDNPAGSYIEGDLYDNGGFRCGYKAIATPGKMVYEAKNLSNYYLNNAKNNTINYTYSDTEFAKVKCSDGTKKTIGYTS